MRYDTIRVPQSPFHIRKYKNFRQKVTRYIQQLLSVRHEADVGALTGETEYAAYLWRREHYAAEYIYRNIQIKPPERCVGRTHPVGNTP